MAATLKLRLGSKMLEITSDGKTLDMMRQLSFWSLLPDKCGACKSLDIGLFHKSPKGNDYYGLKCISCGAEYTFHQKKEGGFYNTPEDKWERFVPGQISSDKAALREPGEEDRDW